MTIVDPFAAVDQYCRWIDIHPFAERDHYCKWTNDDVITLWNHREFVLMLIGLTLPYRRHLRRAPKPSLCGGPLLHILKGCDGL